MTFKTVSTTSAPQAIGPYSQAVKVGNTIYLSGQIPLVPETMMLHLGSITDHIHQVFSNLRAVAQAAGGDLNDVVKITIFLTDLTHFSLVNEIMTEYFQAPYPARSTVGVATLPKGALLEVEAIMVLPDVVRSRDG